MVTNNCYSAGTERFSEETFSRVCILIYEYTIIYVFIDCSTVIIVSIIRVVYDIGRDYSLDEGSTFELLPIFLCNLDQYIF